MRPANPIIILIFAILSTRASAQTQSPRAQFQAAVEAFQKSATEGNLQNIVLLYKKLTPPPAIPEQAEFHAQKGATFVKLAKAPADFERAAKEFQAAVSLAPWNAEYHYNLAVCYKSAEQFNSALTTVKFAQMLARYDKERHEALGLRAEIEASQEMHAAHKENEKAGERKAFEGHWVQYTLWKYSDGRDAPLSSAAMSFDISIDDNGEAKVISHYSDALSGWKPHPSDEFRGRLVNGELVVNPIRLSGDEQKRELRFRRTEQGLFYRATIIQRPGQSEWTIEFNVRR